MGIEALDLCTTSWVPDSHKEMEGCVTCGRRRQTNRPHKSGCLIPQLPLLTYTVYNALFQVNKPNTEAFPERFTTKELHVCLTPVSVFSSGLVSKNSNCGKPLGVSCLYFVICSFIYFTCIEICLCFVGET